MAVPIVNFESSLDESNNLVLEDTTDYNDNVISNRYWVLTDFEGTLITINHPLIEGNTKVVPLKRDQAYAIKLSLNYNPLTNTESYKKEKNVLVAPFLTEIIYDLRKSFIGLLLENQRSEKTLNLLKEIELIDAFMEAAIRLLSTDLVASQQALDKGNDQANDIKCNL